MIPKQVAKHTREMHNFETVLPRKMSYYTYKTCFFLCVPNFRTHESKDQKVF